MLWIYTARIIAVSFIVILHSASFLFNNSEINTYSWWVGNVLNSLSRWAVPIFVMISGILLLDASKKNTTGEFYLCRASRILIPTVFWALIYSFLWYYQVKLSGEEISVKEIIYNLISGKPYYHMWFMFMITGMYFFTPFIKRMVSTLDNSEFNIISTATFLLSIIYIIDSYISGFHSVIWPLWCLPFIPYFVFGYYMRKRTVNLSLTTLMVLCVILITLSSVSTSYVSARTGANTSYFFEPLSVFVIPFSICVFFILKRLDHNPGEKLKILSGLTMGVYLVHPIFLGLFFKTFKAFTLNNPISGSLTAAFFSLSFSFLTTFFISKTPVFNKTI